MIPITNCFLKLRLLLSNQLLLQLHLQLPFTHLMRRTMILSQILTLLSSYTPMSYCRRRDPISCSFVPQVHYCELSTGFYGAFIAPPTASSAYQILTANTWYEFKLPQCSGRVLG